MTLVSIEHIQTNKNNNTHKKGRKRKKENITVNVFRAMLADIGRSGLVLESSDYPC